MGNTRISESRGTIVEPQDNSILSRVRKFFGLSITQAPPSPSRLGRFSKWTDYIPSFIWTSSNLNSDDDNARDSSIISRPSDTNINALTGNKPEVAQKSKSVFSSIKNFFRSRK